MSNLDMNPFKKIKELNKTLNKQNLEFTEGEKPKNSKAAKTKEDGDGQKEAKTKEAKGKDTKAKSAQDKSAGKGLLGLLNEVKKPRKKAASDASGKDASALDDASNKTVKEKSVKAKPAKAAAKSVAVKTDPTKPAKEDGNTKNTTSPKRAAKKADTTKNASSNRTNDTKKAATKKTNSKGILDLDTKIQEFHGRGVKPETGVERQIANIVMERPKKRTQAKTGATKPVKIIPLGGLEQIGMNITAFEYDDSIFIVDCGLAFPSEDMLGIDLVIPDVTYLKDNFDKVKGFVITHGHEDHIGSLPYILQQLNVPVYGTRLTCALIERKLKERGMDKSVKMNVVNAGNVIQLGDFEVEFIRTNHSIADAVALAIFSPVGTIFHTGDFKIDYTPVFGQSIDLQRMAEIGREGCLLMLCESTNATKPGFTMSEKTVGRTFDMIFAENTNRRIIVATFASNVDRVQQIINSAYKSGRKVVVEGRSMVNVIGVASELGYIDIPEGTLIDIDNLKNYPPEKTVLITTGSQGESMAALSRMASSIHRKVSVGQEDLVIMSSTPIPGNEKAVAKVINELAMRGAEVIYQDTHVSGHACQEEIKLMYSLLKPKFSLPIHGEFRHRMAQKKLAESMGMDKDNIAIIASGDVLAVTEDEFKVVDHVEAGMIFVDGLGVGDVGNIVLRDRQNLSQNGIIIIAMSLQKGSNQLMSGPDIVSRGFVYVRESERLMAEAREVVENAVSECLDSRVTDWTKMKNIVRDALSDYLWKKMKRNPVILPIIMEV